MKSRKYIPNINQSNLIQQMKTFLSYLGEELSKKGGLCNGFSVLIMRASMIGEQEQYLQRLYTLSRANEHKLKKMANLLIKYRAHYQANQPELVKKLKACDSKESHAEIRATHLATIEAQALAKLDEADKKLLSYALELYTFISSLLFAQDPEIVNLHVGKRAIKQDDYLDILDVIPCDEQKKEEKAMADKQSLKKAVTFGFDFEEAELVNVFKKMIFPNDFVHIYSTNHAMYLFKEDDMYVFYDPNIRTGIIKTSSCEEVVSRIKKSLFANMLGWVSAQYLPTGFDIYEREQKHVRSKTKDLIHEILTNRGEDSHIDARGWRGQTALLIAAKSNNMAVCKELLAKKANPHIEDDNGTTPALCAILNGNKDFIKLMVEEQQHLNKPNKIGVTPLHVAALVGQEEIVKVILEEHQPDEKIDVNDENKSGETTAILAAQEGHISVLEVLIKHGVNLNKENKQGWTAATKAADKGQVNVLRFLAKNGVNLAKEDKDGWTPLLLAVSNGHLKVVKVLAQQKISVHKGTKKVSSPIHLAAAKGHAELVQFLADSKVNLTKKNHEGYTPAMFAAVKNHIHILEILAKNGVDFTNKKIQRELAVLAIENDKPDVIKFLIQKGFNINKDIEIDSSIESLASFNQPLMLKAILPDLKMNFNRRRGKKGLTVAYIAAEKNNVDMLQVLHESKIIDLNIKSKNGLTPLAIAIKKTNEKVINFYINKRPEDVVHYLHSLQNINELNAASVEILKKHRGTLSNAFLKMLDQINDSEQYQQHLNNLRNHQGGFAGLFVNPNLVSFMKECLSSTESMILQIINAFLSTEISILDMFVNFDFTKHKKIWIEVANRAACEGNADVIEFLAKQGFDLTEQDNLGWSPVSNAASHGHIALLLDLVKHNVKLDIPDKYEGWTPILTAAKHGNLPVVIILADQKEIDINGGNKKNGITALHRATCEGHSDIVEFLIEHKADLDKKDHSGQSAVMHAIRHKQLEIFEILLKQDINLAQVDKEGRSLFIIAAEEGQDEMLQLLIKKGMKLENQNLNMLTPAAVEFFIADYPEQMLRLLLSLRDLTGFSHAVRETLRIHSKEMTAAFSKLVIEVSDTVIQNNMVKDLVNKCNAFGLIFEKPSIPEVDFSFIGLAKSFFSLFSSPVPMHGKAVTPKKSLTN